MNKMGPGCYTSTWRPGPSLATFMLRRQDSEVAASAHPRYSMGKSPSSETALPSEAIVGGRLKRQPVGYPGQWFRKPSTSVGNTGLTETLVVRLVAMPQFSVLIGATKAW